MGRTKSGPLNERGEDRDEQLMVEAERRKRCDRGPLMLEGVFTEDERTTLTNGLRVAAEQFEKHVTDLRRDARAMTPSINREEGDTVIHYERLAGQFEQQARESRELADKIEEAD